MAMIRTEQCFILLSRAIRFSEPGKQKDIVFCDQRKQFELFFHDGEGCLKDAGPNVSKSGKPIRPEAVVMVWSAKISSKIQVETKEISQRKPNESRTVPRNARHTHTIHPAFLRTDAHHVASW